MHIMIRDPGTGNYVELCIPTYSKLAIVIRCSTYVTASLWDRVETLAKASGCTDLLDASLRRTEPLPTRRLE